MTMNTETKRERSAYEYLVELQKVYGYNSETGYAYCTGRLATSEHGGWCTLKATFADLPDTGETYLVPGTIGMENRTYTDPESGEPREYRRLVVHGSPTEPARLIAREDVDDVRQRVIDDMAARRASYEAKRAEIAAAKDAAEQAEAEAEACFTPRM